jgi:tetratricopeptide (TPR) repeat protein
MSEDNSPSRREAIRLYEQARDAFARNEPAESLGLLRECLARVRGSADGALSGTVLFEMGFLLTSLDRPDEAVDAYEESLLFHDRADAKRETAVTLFQLASAYRLVGRSADAEDAYVRLRTLCRELGDRRGEGIAASVLGRMQAERDGAAAGLPAMIEGAALVLAAAPDEAELMLDHVKFFGRAELGEAGFAELVRRATRDEHVRRRLGA